MKKYPIHKTVDLETGEPIKTYYTQNPIPEGSPFEVLHEGRTLLFQLDHHLISNETLSLIQFLGEKNG